MSKFLVLLYSLFFIILIPAFSQSKDEAAKLVLDEFNSKTRTLPGALSKFSFTVNDMSDNSEAIYVGSFLLKGEMYKVVMDDMEIYYDGETLWNYIIEAGEVNVLTPPEDADPDSYFENPVRFFSIYEKDFFYKYIGEETREGKALHVIDLYPKDLNRSFNRIRIIISKEKLELYSTKLFGKNKIHYTLKILSFVSKDIPDEAFAFDPASHPDVDIIDLR